MTTPENETDGTVATIEIETEIESVAEIEIEIGIEPVCFQLTRSSR